MMNMKTTLESLPSPSMTTRLVRNRWRARRRAGGVRDWGLPATPLSRVRTLRTLFTVFKKNLYLNNCKVIEKLQIQRREFCIFLSPIPSGLG